MPYKKPVIEKVYYSIGEVASMFNVNNSLIRFWEKEFPSVKPHKNKKGNRLFTKDDLEQLKLIYHLVKERGLTLEGARKKIRENQTETVDNFAIVDRLKNIRQMLVEIKDEL
ncbi:MAG: MerR family transcriptional regulator [Bacteroidetes bacterium GWF2_42_66]|nr:MAG: MerR family transcriptional regulator [Bacteroidetes bacterium GWA2_42_15]OFX99977.1 MAG: MerR family transcriptional regulator [Bacteroidetes bacterium GWE2_42_39]OFY40162.1 MAG: MerR family transcriptional regulator [Bacteroidetes bacterium GWF2_42_66]HBL73990.1 MerR family transcriptional regulator [Prolixibacteraceae bacterium]HCR91896.1 MerR family transcriptional regulator [Prolixibacteraceae bacterium]